MLKKEPIDILTIATDNKVHYDIIKEAVNYKIKAILCEKPFTNRLAKAKSAVQLCQRNRIFLAIDHSRRWDTVAHKIKDLIDKKEVGEIKEAFVYYVRGIANTASHIFDLLRFFFGEVATVKTLPENTKFTDDPSLDVELKFNCIGDAVAAVYDFLAPKEGMPDFRVSVAGYSRTTNGPMISIKNRHQR